MRCAIFLQINILCVFGPLCCAYSTRSARDSNRKLLQTMTSYMNLRINPCQDFYRYACGNWENLLPAHVDYLDTIGSLEHGVNRRLKDLLEKRMFKYKMATNEIYYKVHEYYKSCRQQRQFDALEYLRILKPTEADEWPSVEDVWRPKKPWHIFSSLGRLYTTGFNGFLITLDLKTRNATHFLLHLDKLQSLGFSSYEQKILDEMDNSLVKQTRSISQKIQSFMEHLATLDKNHNSNFPRQMTMKEFEQQISSTYFKAFFSAILGSDHVQHLPLMVANLDYFRKLCDLVEKTSANTLIHVLKLKFLGYLVKQMPQTSSPSKCLQHMRDLMPLALDYIYEKEIFQYKRNATELVVHKLFQNLQQEFVNRISEHGHELSTKEIKFLKDKIMHMKLNIGNLPLAASEDYYQDYFAGWQFYEGFFYWNHLNALQHQSNEKFNMMHMQWFSPLHTYFYWPFGSPAYQPSTNLLIIPHSYLQYPIFQADFHEIFLYAELGNTLGHEMLHAFDTNGLQYDSRGNPSEIFIKNLPYKRALMSSLECLNKKKTSSLNEKIADFGGFRLAYEAFFRRPFVPKLRDAASFTTKQLFFIKFAQFFCAVNPKRIHYDESHDTPFLRVEQVVTGHTDFAQVFGCARSADSMRESQCNLW